MFSYFPLFQFLLWGTKKVTMFHLAHVSLHPFCSMCWPSWSQVHRKWGIFLARLCKPKVFWATLINGQWTTILRTDNKGLSHQGLDTRMEHWFPLCLWNSKDHVSKGRGEQKGGWCVCGKGRMMWSFEQCVSRVEYKGKDGSLLPHHQLYVCAWSQKKGY